MAKKPKTIKIDTSNGFDKLTVVSPSNHKLNIKSERSRKDDTYHEAIGRRKTAVARVRIFPGDNKPSSESSTALKGQNKKIVELLLPGKQEITINNKDFTSYFSVKELQDVFMEPLTKSETKSYKISIKVFGGGLRAQAYAVRHGLSRALILLYPESKTILKAFGFLTRDSRMKERKKPGLKGARRAPQWSKR